MTESDLTGETVTIGDIEVRYTRHGSGRPVVLVHGLAEGRRSWHAVQEGLADVTTFAYDLRGHGDTTLGTGAGNLSQLRDDLIGFLELVTGPATCIGFSLGGTIVLAAAAERPDLVRTVVALGTSSVVGRGAAAFYAQRIELFRGSDAAAQHAALRDDTVAALHDSDVLVDRVTAERTAAVGDGGGYVNAATAMAALAGDPLTLTLAGIGPGTRTWIVGADHDTFCPKKASDIILAAIPHARYAEIVGAGHLMAVDQPAQTIEVLARAVNT
ncbi:alpha/beta fold hydrolase [Gordonia sp. CPCC 206044]|uniref:alpha/beta fold hydrolase n=1 Tax=Gordonia sp. CPCC 206044 TaxID=3140793 RepID=UPI003AF3D0A4